MNLKQVMTEKWLKELDARDKEIEQLRNENVEACLAFVKSVHVWRQQLSAAQLENQKLREALEYAASAPDVIGSVAYTIDVALSAPADESALRDYVADEMIEMGKQVNNRNTPSLEVYDYAERYRRGEV